MDQNRVQWNLLLLKMAVHQNQENPDFSGGATQFLSLTDILKNSWGLTQCHSLGPSHLML